MHSGLNHLKEEWEKASHKSNYKNIIHPYYDETGFFDACQLAEIIKPNKDLIILDFGCGTGRVTEHLAKFYGKIIAVDISNGMINKLNSLNITNIEPYISNGLDLIGKIPPVHGACSYICFIHNKKSDVEKIFLQIRDAIYPPHGLFACDLPCYEYDSKEPDNWTDVGVWSPEEIRTLANRTGFNIYKLFTNKGRFSYSNIGSNHSELQVFEKA